MQLDADMETVACALGHQFREPTLLRDALTHRSYANEHPDLAPSDNERLEFLGDAVLTLGASAILWEQFPSASEGELTRRRADLVCEAGLADLGRELGIGRALRLGRGEERSGGRAKPRLLCCAMEACVAAVYLDGGIDAAISMVRRILGPRLSAPELGQRDYKTRLQEAVQARGEVAPRYHVVESSGPDHAREFHVVCAVGDRELGRGLGRSKIEAEQGAARTALEAMNHDRSE